ncbi:MAG: hypothetical protein LAO78_27340 [Acidobacteriia bacterium]|nr:hypothetical protein [Terriglobia bacterium]
MRDLSPFKLMWTLWWGLYLSLAYGVASFFSLWGIKNKSEAQQFALAYTSSFKTIVSLGLILGTALIIFRYQNVIVEVIETAFTKSDLSTTEYFTHKRVFQSALRSIEFSAEFIIVGFIIFSYCRFPLQGLAERLMVIAACIEYALGVYVGRKLLAAGLMLHALLKVKVTRNLFARRELDDINTFVNVASTLTIIFVYVHVMGYHGGPFKYDSMLGPSVKIFLVLPAVIATPVLLIFNFYPREVLRRLYRESIDLEITRLQGVLQNEKVSASEQRSYLLQFDKLSREELRYSLQLTINDLPIGITILAMVLQPLLKR